MTSTGDKNREADRRTQAQMATPLQPPEETPPPFTIENTAQSTQLQGSNEGQGQGQSQGLPCPSGPQLSFFTLRSETGRGPHHNTPRPEITVSVSDELTSTDPHSSNNNNNNHNDNSYNNNPNPSFNARFPQSFNGNALPVWPNTGHNFDLKYFYLTPESRRVMKQIEDDCEAQYRSEVQARGYRPPFMLRPPPILPPLPGFADPFTGEGLSGGFGGAPSYDQGDRWNMSASSGSGFGIDSVRGGGGVFGSGSTQVYGPEYGHGRTASGSMTTTPNVPFQTPGSSSLGGFGSSPSPSTGSGPGSTFGSLPGSAALEFLPASLPPRPPPPEVSNNSNSNRSSGRGRRTRRRGRSSGRGGAEDGGFQQTVTPYRWFPVQTGNLNVNMPSFMAAQTSSPLSPRSGPGTGSGGDSSRLLAQTESPVTPTPMRMGGGQKPGKEAGTGLGSSDRTSTAGRKRTTTTLSTTSVPLQPSLGFTPSSEMGSASGQDNNTAAAAAGSTKEKKTGIDSNTDAREKNDIDEEVEGQLPALAETYHADAKTTSLTVSEATHLVQFSTSPTIAGPSTLPTRSINVALYSPLGSFLPPLQPITLTSNTTLKELILKLQDVLVTSLEDSRSLARLLVQSVQVRTSDLEGIDRVEGFDAGVHWKTGEKLTLELPRIEGLLSEDSVEGGMVVGKTKWVAWEATTGGKGESERFWGALVWKLLVDVLRRGGEGMGASGKAPILKVRTVVKVGDLVDGEDVSGEKIAGGGHLFRVPPGAILPAKNIIAEKIFTPRASIAAQGGQGATKGSGQAEAKKNKGKGKKNKASDKRKAATSNSDKAEASTKPHQRGASNSAENSFAPTSTSHSSLQIELNRQFYKHHQAKKQSQEYRESSHMASAASDDKLAEAEALLKDLNLLDKAKEVEGELLKKVNAESGSTESDPSQTDKRLEKLYYEKMMGVNKPTYPWIQKGGYPKDAPYDEKHNWDKFRRWGEKETDPDFKNKQALHDAIPLKHVPFFGPKTKPWPDKGKQKATMGKDKDNNEAPMKMVPYTAIDADEFKQKILEEANSPENMPDHIKKYWEDQERIKGMDEVDDDTFFPAGNPDVIKREQASKVFAAKEFKNPARNKNVDIISKLQDSTQRRSVSNSASLSSFFADGPSSAYDNMPTTGAVQPGPASTVDQSQNAGGNNFSASLSGVHSFSSLAKQDIKSSSPSPGFYELSKAIATHVPDKDVDAFIYGFEEPPENQEDAGTTDQQEEGQVPSYGDFNTLPYGYGGTQTAGGLEGYGAMSNQQQGDGYTTMGGNAMSQNMMGGSNAMGGRTMSENMMGGNNAMSGSYMGGNQMGSSMMGGGNNQTPGSFNSFGTPSGNSSDLRGIVTHGFLAAPNLPNSGWTSMNAGGAAYSGFSGQSGSFNSAYQAPANNTQSRGMGGFPQYGQSGFPTPTPSGRTQSRLFNPADIPRPTPGSEQYAFNNLPVARSQAHPAPGSFVNPLLAPTNQNLPAAGSSAGYGSSRSRTHGVHVGSNPTTTSRARRPAAIPIVAPPGHVAASVPGFQLPSPSRQAIGYGAGIGSSTASLGKTTHARVKGTGSPEKKKKAKEEFSAAIASAFNGPKNSPASGSNA